MDSYFPFKNTPHFYLRNVNDKSATTNKIHICLNFNSTVHNMQSFIYIHNIHLAIEGEQK